METHLKKDALPTEYNLIDRSTNATDTVLSYTHFYDNNGNITHYCDAQGNIVAAYTYDAFGNIIAQSGPMADYFRHRFSTKYLDAETGLYYYGYRFYSPELMRWINRDPIEEQGGVNLYAFCGNNAINKWDKLGHEFGITYVQFEGLLDHAWIRLGTEQSYDVTELFEKTLTYDGVKYDVKSATATLPVGIGFYPNDVVSKINSLSLHDGMWKYEAEKELLAAQINTLKEFETDLKNRAKGKLEYGESKGSCCKNATKGDVVSCLKDYAAQHPRQTYWLPFLNCRARAQGALSACCLKVGKRIPHVNYGSIEIAINPTGDTERCLKDFFFSAV